MASEEGQIDNDDDDLDESRETDGLLFSGGALKNTPSRRQLEEDASVQFPKWAYAIIVTLTTYTLIYAYVKGTYVTPCSGQLWFWLFYLTPMPLCEFWAERKRKRKREGGREWERDERRNERER